MAIRVVLEVTPKRTFASALDWPGWARSAKTADEALDALVAYGLRYAPVAEGAHVAFTPPKTIRPLDVVERLTGGGGTEFGVPGAPAAAEAAELGARETNRLISLLQAAWITFDRASAGATGTILRLGPRGGGRQVPKMVDHVRDAESAYLHQLGWKVTGTATMDELRTWFVEAVRLRAAGDPLPVPNRVHHPWEPRYAVRRSAWHALDHAWEIEDRSPGR
jgi:hypothetical protein